jgi:capsular exopolysaccharide synthesis family protein
LGPPERLPPLQLHKKDLRDRIQRAAEQVTLAEARIARIEDATTIEDKIAAANDAQLTRLGQTGQASDAFDARFAQVVARAELDLARATDQQAALIRSQESLAEQIARQGDDLIQLQQLTREAEASGTLYEYFLSRLKETSAQQGIQQADSRLLSAAVIPNTPTAPRKTLVMVMCLVLGVMLGAGLVLIREAMKNSFRTARELEDMTGVVVMGQIPLIPGKARKDILTYMRTKPTSAAMEAIRNLRTSVLLSNVDNPPQVIISTSSVPGEGKTTNSLALAMNLVGIGKSVLLIEGDIRRNTLSEYFPKSESGKGLVSLLSGAAKIDEVLVRHEDIGLSLIMGEKSSINAADLFMSDSYRQFLREMRETFDYIIIDTPPVLVVPDARIISQTADAVLFTVKWNDTSRGLVDEAIQMFSSVNQKVAGLILSQVDGEEMKRYGGKYGGYGSGAAYGAKYYTD